jgi:hypothetical protein
VIYLSIPAALLCVAFASPELLLPVRTLLHRTAPSRPAAAPVEFEPQAVPVALAPTARRQ